MPQSLWTTWGLCVGAALVMGQTARGDEPVGLTILPPMPELTSPGEELRLIAERREGDQFTADESSRAKWSSDHPEFVTVDERGVVRGVGNGAAIVTVEVDGRKAATRVEARGQNDPLAVSFRHDVQSVLTRAGCNMGACHGAQAGKKGFKLTLRGYDSERDYLAITRQARGRRVVPGDAESSLLLQKALGDIPHSGGVRFERDSLDHVTLRDWIQAGAPGPSANDTRVEAIEVHPESVRLSAGGTQQFSVIARYSGGRRRDVTRWAKFTATEAAVASVDDHGQATVVGVGEAAIVVWFAGKVRNATISVPSAAVVTEDLFAASPRRNFIDDHVLEKLRSLRIPPSPQTDDSRFLRRAYMDTIGLLPTADETRNFLADNDPAKREKLVDALLSREEYVDYWAYKWSDLLLVSTKKLKGPAVWSFAQWVRGAVRQNVPWDRFARDVLTAGGGTLDNGAANYFVLHKDPKLVTEATTVTFLGFSINCAQCHDHPLERWTLDDYYGMANLFARVRMKDGGTDGDVIVMTASDGDVKHPTRTATPIPRPLDGEPLALDDARDRRQHLANWLTSPDNPYFARAVVNRVWANYMGRGLVESVDDMRLTNPPSNGPLLAALTRDFVEGGYDIKRLIRTIMNSAAYARAAGSLPENSADDRFHSHFLIKRMSAEVLLDTYSQVLGVPTEFPDYPKGLRALQLPDTNVVSYFLSTFGRPVREFTCECERTEEPNVTQTLHLANGESLNGKLKSPTGTLDTWLKSGKPDAELVDELYMSALARQATAGEREAVLRLIAEAVSEGADDAAKAIARRQAWEDVCWAVLTSKEFLFVH
jgi:hypothetical protein